MHAHPPIFLVVGELHLCPGAKSSRHCRRSASHILGRPEWVAEGSVVVITPSVSAQHHTLFNCEKKTCVAVASAVGPLARRPIRIDSPKLVSSHAQIAVLVRLKTCLRFPADSAKFMIGKWQTRVFRKQSSQNWLAQKQGRVVQGNRVSPH